MRPKPVWISLAIIGMAAVLGVARLCVKAADTLPSQYTDAEFWRMVTDFSEAGGDYQYENFVSNEISYQEVIPELSRLAKAGGVYFGVASEQNFTYIDVVRPKVAFIFDVRRQNTLLLLIYKALFEMSDNLRATGGVRSAAREAPPEADWTESLLLNRSWSRPLALSWTPWRRCRRKPW